MFQALLRSPRLRRGRFAALLCLPLTLLTPSARAQSEDAPPTLSLGEGVTRELQGGGAHAYRLEAGAAQFLHLVVRQIGIDVAVLLYAPDGRKLAEVDSPNGTTGPEPVFAVTEAGGAYRVEVRSLEKTAPAGRYEVRLEERRAATARDGKRIAAERLFADEDYLLVLTGTNASGERVELQEFYFNAEVR